MTTLKRGKLALKIDSAIRIAFADEITVDETRFQPRNPEAAKYPEKARRESLDHAKALADALERNGGTLDPLVLYKRPRSGELVVLEGHHRLKAYKLYQRRKKLERVEVCYRLFTGTFDEARMLARSSNVKQFLNMTAGEKTENSWQVVISLGGEWDSNRALGRLLGVAESTIRSQRKAFSRHFLNTKPSEVPSWKEVRSLNFDKENPISGDEYMAEVERMAVELASSEWMDEVRKVARKNALHRDALREALSDTLGDYGLAVRGADSFLDDEDDDPEEMF